jgi:hypothetical protein
MLQRKLLIAVCIVQVVSTTIFVPTILEFRKYNYLADSSHTQEIRNAIQSHMYFDDSDNRWCNTLLLVDISFGKAVDTEIWKVPAGIGVSHLHDPSKLDLPISSKYVFLSESAMDSLYYSEVLSERIAPLVIIDGQGVLFNNPHANCIPNTKPI